MKKLPIVALFALLITACGDEVETHSAAITTSDRQVVGSVRQSLMSDGQLSEEAQNVKVVVNGGTVYLRGRVKSEPERRAVESKARMTFGARYVENELDVE